MVPRAIFGGGGSGATLRTVDTRAKRRAGGFACRSIFARVEATSRCARRQRAEGGGSFCPADERAFSPLDAVERRRRLPREHRPVVERVPARSPRLAVPAVTLHPRELRREVAHTLVGHELERRPHPAEHEAPARDWLVPGAARTRGSSALVRLPASARGVCRSRRRRRGWRGGPQAGDARAPVTGPDDRLPSSTKGRAAFVEEHAHRRPEGDLGGGRRPLRASARAPRRWGRWAVRREPAAGRGRRAAAGAGSVVCRWRCVAARFADGTLIHGRRAFTAAAAEGGDALDERQRGPTGEGCPTRDAVATGTGGRPGRARPRVSHGGGGPVPVGEARSWASGAPRSSTGAGAGWRAGGAVADEDARDGARATGAGIRSGPTLLLYLRASSLRS